MVAPWAGHLAKSVMMFGLDLGMKVRCGSHFGWKVRIRDDV